MTHYDDETLGAYVDGELERETAAALTADLGNDPVLQRRVADLRAINAAVREWSAGLVPPQVAARPTGALFANQNSRRRHAASGFKPLWSHALAAGIALVFGLGLGQFVSISPRQSGPGAEAAASRLLQAALEHTASGQAVSWTDDTTHHSVTVQPLRTYHATSTFCREYRETAVLATQASERTMYGLACRDPEGIWNVEYELAPGARSLLAQQ
jgi:anti-sigma factor RsiW